MSGTRDDGSVTPFSNWAWVPHIETCSWPSKGCNFPGLKITFPYMNDDGSDKREVGYRGDKGYSGKTKCNAQGECHAEFVVPNEKPYDHWAENVRQDWIYDQLLSKPCPPAGKADRAFCITHEGNGNLIGFYPLLAGFPVYILRKNFSVGQPILLSAVASAGAFLGTFFPGYDILKKQQVNGDWIDALYNNLDPSLVRAGGAFAAAALLGLGFIGSEDIASIILAGASAGVTVFLTDKILELMFAPGVSFDRNVEEPDHFDSIWQALSFELMKLRGASKDIAFNLVEEGYTILGEGKWVVVAGAVALAIYVCKE